MVRATRALHGADGAAADDQPLLRELAHHLGEALALDAAEEVLRRHGHVVEEELGGVGGLQADLVELAAAAEAGGAVGLDGEEADALGASRGSVLAATRMRLACWPLVMKIFEPVRR